jgi:ketosteroid isomerase-like protein
LIQKPAGAAHTVLRLIQHINSHDVDALAALLTVDHRFIDSLGTVVSGRDSLREGWRQYFRMVPDYRIEVQRTFVDRSDVVLLGSAAGTYSTDGTLDARNAWATPGAWHAELREDLIATWQVYADNEPIRRCMRAAAESHSG